MADPLHGETAKKFFASLYKQPPMSPGEFDRLVTGIVAKHGDTTVVGDQALQALLLNYVLHSPQGAEKAKEMTAALAGIKQRAVSEFSKAFPAASLDDLIQAAGQAGYDVEVLQ